MISCERLSWSELRRSGNSRQWDDLATTTLGVASDVPTATLHIQVRRQTPKRKRERERECGGGGGWGDDEEHNCYTNEW